MKPEELLLRQIKTLDPEAGKVHVSKESSLWEIAENTIKEVETGSHHRAIERTFDGAWVNRNELLRRPFHEVIFDDLSRDVQALIDGITSDETLPRRSAGMLLKGKLPKGKEMEIANFLKKLAKKAEVPAPGLSSWLEEIARHAESCAKG